MKSIMKLLRLLSKHLPRFRRLFYSVLFLFAFLGLFYFISLLLSSFDLYAELLKRVGVSLGTRALSASLVKTGCCGGLSLAIIFAIKSLLTAEVAPNMMGPAGTDSGASGASSSGSWHKYLNLFSEDEERAEAESSTAPAPSDQPGVEPAAENPGEVAPEPSTSSTWSGPWIDRWMNPEVGSSAPNPGGRRDEATSQPPGVVEQEAASPLHATAIPPEIRAEIVSNINSRLLLAAEKKGGWQLPTERINTLIELKSQVISSMSKLDPHPFWGENQHYLLSYSIFTKKNWEYNPETLHKKLDQLNEKGKNSSFFHELLKVRESFEP
jgi:hypothetical protein